jgi:minor extracellular protease Epr
MTVQRAKLFQGGGNFFCFQTFLSYTLLSQVDKSMSTFTLSSMALLGLGLLPLTANAQLLPLPPLPSQVIGTLDKTTERQTERLNALKQQGLLEQQLQQSLASKATLLNPLTQLPNIVPVVNALGQTVFNDVAVEQGLRAVEREWLLLLSASQWQQLLTQAPELESYLSSQITLTQLQLQLIKIRVPSQLDNMAALRLNLPELLAPYLSRNYIYQTQTAEPLAHQETPNPAPSSKALATTVPAAPICDQPITLGMVDTAISPHHSALTQTAQFALLQRSFLAEGIAISYAHGTAVAGVLAGRDKQLNPLLPSLTLLNAGAFYAQNAYQQGASLESILQALNWLVSEGVRVVNMSLTGPDNPVLQQVVTGLAEQGTVLIAAAGNGGPAAAPLFPAAYPQVIAVTAVDKQLELYRWANQGDYIDFAALGVKVLTTRADGSIGMESGTSMATPVVTAKIACLLAAKPELDLSQIVQQLQQKAVDLGVPGKDPLFGHGVLVRP